MIKKLLFLLFILGFYGANSQAQSIINRFKKKIADKVDQKVDKAIDKGAQQVVDAPGVLLDANGNPVSNNGAAAGNAEQVKADASPAFKTYQNYDFVAGEQILFEDHFTDEQDGEFPSHWKLVRGQAVMNKVDTKPALLLTDGNYAEVTPRMKKDHYLGEAFTLEFDFIYKTVTDIGYGNHSDAPGVEFYCTDVVTHQDDWQFRVVLGIGDVKIGDMTKTYPSALLEGFQDKWHHAAIVYKDGQMKAYVDQFRVCVNPNLENKPFRVGFDGVGNDNAPIIFSNIKIANGGGMNMIGKKFTDTKLITHGINFDIDKATIKPESMGTLNMIVQLLNDNPELKFEIGGHTDNSGTATRNLPLSQQRAEAVKVQLIKLGIDQSRLSTKGYGDTKPIADNITPEGKANNRRVEFVKV